MIACIACGGVGEWFLITAGLGWIIAWFKKRHNKKKCKCCQSHIIEDHIKNSRSLTSEESKSVNEFFDSKIKG